LKEKVSVLFQTTVNTGKSVFFFSLFLKSLSEHYGIFL